MNSNKQSMEDLRWVESIDRNVLRMKDGCIMTFIGDPKYKIPFLRRRHPINNILNRRVYIERTVERHVKNHAV